LAEVNNMTKSTITRTWIAGLVVLAGGLVVVGLSVGLMVAYGGTFTAAPTGDGYDFVPRLDSFFWTTVGFMVLGATAVVAGGIVQLAAWIGALINTNRIPQKTWFAVLLVGGLLGIVFAPIGFAAMVAYVVAGPDGMMVEQQPAPGTPQRALAPTS
jgi:hypothetical protein